MFIYFKDFFLMIKYVRKLNKYILLIYPFKIILVTMRTLMMVFFPKFILDELIAGNYKNVFFLIAFMAILTFVLNIFYSLLQNIWSHNYNVMTSAMGYRHAEKNLNCEFKLLEDTEYLDLQQRVRSNMKPTDYLYTVSTIIENILQLSLYVYLIFALNAWIAIAIILFCIFNIFIGRSLNKENYNYDQFIAPITRKIQYFFKLANDFTYGKDIRINQMDTLISNKLNESYTELASENKRHVNKISFVKIVLLGISFLWEVVMYAIITYSTIIGEITVGSFSMYITVFSNFITKATELIWDLTGLKFWSKNIAMLKEYEGIPSFDKSTDSNTATSDIANSHDIEFTNVSFKYPNSSKFVLKNVNIKVKTGEKVMIVGLNGAGKSTFVKLLCRFYEPSQGKILIGGKDITTIDQKIFNDLIAVILQDFKLFSYTIKENILLNQEYREDDFNRALVLSMLDEKLSKLDKGVETTLFKEFDEDGIEMSGGELQKIALARAIYHSSEIYILDEPNSAMDPLTENKFYENFKQISKDKTTIYISHRLSSATFCDKVVVFDKGEIIEYGSHDDLMKNEGFYAQLFKTQADNYIQVGDCHD